MSEKEKGASTEYPAPKLPKAGKVSRYANAILIANPALKANPRRAGTHGFRFHEIVRAAGPEGISYSDLKAAVEADETILGFSNHLQWDLDRNFIVVKK